MHVCCAGKNTEGRTLPKPPEPISQSLPSECLAMTMSSGLISQEVEGTTSGRLDAPLYCLRRNLPAQLCKRESSAFVQGCTRMLPVYTTATLTIHRCTSSYHNGASLPRVVLSGKAQVQRSKGPNSARRPGGRGQRVLQLVQHC